MKGENQVSRDGRKLRAVDEAEKDSPAVSLRGKAATQDRILRAAGGLFIERGYEHTTIAEVAEMAGVSRATIFWHFGDKAGLFREALAALLVPFRETMAENLEVSDPRQRLEGLVAVYDHFVLRQRETIEGIVRLAIESPDFANSLLPSLMDLHQRFAGDLCETLADIVPEDQDPEALAAGFIALLDGTMLLSFFDGSPTATQRRHKGLRAIAALIPDAKENSTDG